MTILGDDPVVARALELLLRSAGHDARFVADPADKRLDEQRTPFQLLLIAPQVSPERLATLIFAADPARRTPVLELVPLTAAARPHEDSQLSWPCGTERLVRAIDAALLHAARDAGTNNPGCETPAERAGGRRAS